MQFDDDGLDDEEPVRPLLPPDDRLWRHPAEVFHHGPPALRRLGASKEPRVMTVALLAGSIGALLATGLIYAMGPVRTKQVNVPSIQREFVPVVDGSRVGTEGPPNTVAIAERVSPAIVQLRLDGTEAGFSGSGVIFRSEGLVLTNHHVIEGADEITVMLDNSREYKATLVGSDPETDIAVLRVEGGGNFSVATLGTAANLKVGQVAFAIGSPLALAGGPSLTSGVVSALGRRIDGRDGPPLLDMIQTDAPIAPGSSGGALVDGNGAVIGITTALAVSQVGAEGLGFATPIDVARDVAEELLATGQVRHSWIGIEGQDLGATRATELGIDGGALVKRVLENSPAARAGLTGGDVIVAVDGQSVVSMSALVVALRSRDPGEKVSLKVRQEDRERTMQVTLTERPKNPPR